MLAVASRMCLFDDVLQRLMITNRADANLSRPL